ncbi:type IV pilus assembly protein PilY1 [Alkalispirillum mobile]|uniref:Type IV pilus assembly protein PilY1 n=1 Tax=Alkalispirillum mobile TaxID=85925 RepID=A0A498C6C7_9GAMM|nr:PilC/PilY family type IV pilus protein [Alkalispirillum mobile]RLK48630.1 type IV pilus assembly protein PilY1 [Alkalispirillum mobile]
MTASHTKHRKRQRQKTGRTAHGLATFTGVAAITFANGALALDIAQTPLFLQESGLPPNILFIPDTSESMQEGLRDGRVALDANCEPGLDMDPEECPAGARNPQSKASIVKRVGLDLIDRYNDQVNMGLLSYQQSPASRRRADFDRGYTVRWRLVERIVDARYSLDKDPSWYRPDYDGSWDSDTKRFRVEHPDPDEDIWIFFNAAVPGYWWRPGDSGDFGIPNDDQTIFLDFTTQTGLLSAGAYQVLTTNLDNIVHQNYLQNFNVPLVDSLRQRGIDSWGDYVPFLPLNQLEWRSTSSPGLGYLHVPIGGLDQDGNPDEAHWEAIEAKLQPQIHDWARDAMTNPDWPLIASGLTPLEGTIQTAQDYFLGRSNNFGPDQGNTGNLTIPESCDVNAAIWVTDGLPSVDADGNELGDSPGTALANARAAIREFHEQTGVDTYIVGFALPPGVSSLPGVGDDPLSGLAEAGGTERAFDATDEASLDAAMSEIFATIVAQATGSASAVSAASSTYQPEETNLLFQATFNSTDWSGDLTGFEFDFNERTYVEVWNASDELPSASTRNIYTYDGNSGVPFRWGNGQGQGISSAQEESLNEDPDLLDYLRGDPTGELRNGGEWRNRPSPLGDFINSNPAYQGPGLRFNYNNIDGYSDFLSDNQNRPEVVYVGGNAGKLHAFDAETGRELFAYIPSQVFDHLPELADPDYSHRFFVDGQQTIAHAQIDGDWRTVLIGTLGAGGKGVYALDVTDPDDFSADNVLWELGPDDLDSIGHVYGEPMVMPDSGENWFVTFSNGYGSSDGSATLIKADLEPHQNIRQWTEEISTGASNGNGLSPVVVASDRNTAYAGDLRGNLWRFDLQDEDSTRLFTARSPGDERQPITAKPALGTHPDGGRIVLFGTGQYLENQDNQIVDSPRVESFYGIRDYSNLSLPVNRNDLYQIDILTEATVANQNVRVTTSGEDFDGSTHDGWVLNLDYPAPRGERVVEPASIVDGRVEFVTLIPSDDPCAGGGTSYLFSLNAATGGRPDRPPFDLTGDGQFDSAEMVYHEGEMVPVSAVNLDRGILAAPTLMLGPDGQRTRLIGGTDAPEDEPITELDAPPTTGDTDGAGPRAWRQLR